MQSLRRDHANVLGALHPDAVGGEQFLVFVDLRAKEIEEILHFLLEAGVGFVLQAADAESVRGQARAAIFLVDLENLFAVAEGIEQRRDRADIERVRAQPKLMAGHAVQFGQNHANVLGARRSFDVEQFLDRLAVSQAVRDRGDIIHAVDVGIEHRISAMLADLFDAAMQVADDAFEAQNFFAVEPQNHAQHAVGRGMLRSHVDDQLVGVEKRLVGRFEIESARANVRVGHSSLTAGYSRFLRIDLDRFTGRFQFPG